METLPEGTLALLGSTGPFVGQYFAQGKDGIDYFNSVRVLCIGAGGLGCEILKSLALNGFKNIDVIDMDTIDVSNLNRQFLFRAKDVGKSKAETAAKFIKRRVPTCNITAHCCMIQEMDTEFYKSFNVVIGGLDSMRARYWINQKLFEISQTEGICIPYIDGGSESWKGHVKVIFPGDTACMECQNVFSKPKAFQSCTLATKPRLPEHCIAFAKEAVWPKERNGEEIDGDNDEHIQWLMDRAVEHGNKFGITGITFHLTRTVVKNIVPAIASTQAIVASMLTTEALKIVTECAPAADNNINSNNSNGIYLNCFHIEKNEKCKICGRKILEIPRVEGETVEEFRKRLGEKYDCKEASITAPTANGTIRVYSKLVRSTKGNLTKPIAEFIPDNSIAAVATSASKQIEFYLV